MSKEQAEQLFQEAMAIRGRTKYPQVAHQVTILCEKALELDPEHWEAAFWLGNNLRLEKEFDRSIEVYQKAITAVNQSQLSEKDKLLRDLTRGLGQTFFDAGRYEDAAFTFQQHLEIQFNTIGVIWLGRCYVKMGRYQEAIQLLSQFEEHARNKDTREPGLLFCLGQAYKGIGHMDRAEELFIASFHLYPTNPDLKPELEALGYQVVEEGEYVKLAPLSDETVSSKKDGGCFIATAVYGSENAPEVFALRNFRDGVLLTSAVGRTLVNLYYILSPPVARLLSTNLLLRNTVRKVVVRPIANLVRSKRYLT